MDRYHINGTPAPDIGASSITRHLRHQDTDHLRFTLPDPIPEGFAFWTDILVERNGSPYFRGVIDRTPSLSAQGRARRHHVSVSGPWIYLEEIFYRQDWQHIDDPDEPGTLTPKPRARVILNQSDTGEKITVGAQITQILQFAIDAGAQFQIGTIDIPLTAKWDELRNPTCAEAVRKLLRWAPDALWEWDYSTDPPTAHLRRRAAATAVQLPGTDIAEHDITRRDDLARPAVVIEYHRLDRINNIQRELTDYDTHPDPLPAGWQIRGVVIPLQLAGMESQQSWLTQRLQTRPIPSGLTFSEEEIDASDPELPVEEIAVVNFWKRKHPWIDDPSVSGILLRHGNLKTAATDTPQGESPPDLLNLPREVDDEGAIADWMEVQTQRQRARVEIEYTLTPFEGAIPRRKTDILEADLLATDASTRTYAHLQSSQFTPPEPQPSGLAAALHEALQGPHHAGPLTIGGRIDVIRPGQVLDISGAQEEWATMRAVVQRVDEDTRRLRTSIAIGPPEHLSPQQLKTLARVDRELPPTRSWSARSTGMSGTPSSPLPQSTRAAARPGSTSTTLSAAAFPNRFHAHGPIPIDEGALTPDPSAIADLILAKYDPPDAPASGDLHHFQQANYLVITPAELPPADTIHTIHLTADPPAAALNIGPNRLW